MVKRNKHTHTHTHTHTPDRDEELGVYEIGYLRLNLMTFSKGFHDKD